MLLKTSGILAKFRTSVSLSKTLVSLILGNTMLPGPVQAAMLVALGDDAHVAAQKALYRARRAALKPALEAAGFTIDRSEAGLYLWATEGLDAWDSMGRLADLGILAGPGVFYGEHFPQHVRLSLTATDERIASAASRLRSTVS